VPAPPKSLRRQAPSRRRRPSAGQLRRAPFRRISSRARLILTAFGIVFVCILWAAVARAWAPTGNTFAPRFDAIIVLGAGVDSDGNPSPTLLARVTEAVHEYERGVAPRLIFTGGSAFGDHGYIEAAVMSRIAQSEGVPPSSLIAEPHARNTIQNACFSVRIMQQHGWHSAEVVTSPGHLPRAGIIFSATPIHWQAHAAPPLAPQSAFAARAASADEVLHTAYYLVFSRWAQSCSP
jgi:uncharacterized SAM-binding protein YcdF (DUF218 family)